MPLPSTIEHPPRAERVPLSRIFSDRITITTPSSQRCRGGCVRALPVVAALNGCPSPSTAASATR